MVYNRDMLGSFHRFHGLGSLRYVYAKGKTVRSSAMSLRFAPNTKRQTWRAAVVVSKKVSKSAVVRNRIRRRVFEVVRTAGLADKSYDLVIGVYQAEVATLPHDELTRQVHNLLKQAEML